MRKNSLVTKLIISITSIVAIIAICLAIILSLWFKNYFFEEKKNSLEKESYSITATANAYLSLQESSSLNNLQEEIDDLNKRSGADILVTDNLGYTYAVSNEKHEEIRFSKIDISEKDMETLKAGDSIEYRDKVRDGEKKYIYLKPIFNGTYFGGIIVMVQPSTEIYSQLNYVYKMVWISIIIVIIITLITTGILVKKIIVKPLKEINKAANKLSKGEVERRVKIISKDEIGELAQSFNVMAESLERVDKNRKEFISNVSHELRSPITSIKGFVAGILDGIIPKDKEDYYLRIAYGEINRLSRLVGELLDISALENGKFNFKKNRVDINELIKLCLGNLEGNIIEKDRRVEVLLEKEYQFVYADRDRIIQVITNILDNALKYGKTGGYIKIDIKNKGDKVHISVYNEGPALKKEELIKIWDRFYKADKSRTHKESTGLGLPIVRLILTQHGEDIWVNNEKDGVNFTFTLQRV